MQDSQTSNQALNIQVMQVLQKAPKVKKPTEVKMAGYVEIIPKWLKLFQGTWVKYSRDSVPNSGGNLVGIEDVNGYEIVNLRSVRGVVSHVPMEGTIFFVNHASPHYSAYQEVLKAFVKR